MSFWYNYIGDYWKFPALIGYTWGDYYAIVTYSVSGFFKMAASRFVEVTDEFL